MCEYYIHIAAINNENVFDSPLGYLHNDLVTCYRSSTSRDRSLSSSEDHKISLKGMGCAMKYRQEDLQQN